MTLWLISFGLCLGPLKFLLWCKPSGNINLCKKIIPGWQILPNPSLYHNPLTQCFRPLTRLSGQQALPRSIFSSITSSKWAGAHLSTLPTVKSSLLHWSFKDKLPISILTFYPQSLCTISTNYGHRVKGGGYVTLIKYMKGFQDVSAYKILMVSSPILIWFG